MSVDQRTTIYGNKYGPAKLEGDLQDLTKSLYEKFQMLDQFDMIRVKVNEGLTLQVRVDHILSSFKNIIPYDRIGMASHDLRTRLSRVISFMNLFSLGELAERNNDQHILQANKKTKCYLSLPKTHQT